MKLRTTLCLLVLFLLPATLSARKLDEIKRSGKIYVAFTQDDLDHINFDLAQEFARYLNVEMVQVEITWEEAFMRNGTIPEGLEDDASLSYTPDALKKADIICSTFTMMEWRKKLFGFARTLESAELLLLAPGTPAPENFQELDGKKIAFRSGTSIEQHLEEISTSIKGSLDLHATLSGEETRRMLLEKDAYGIVLDADEALNLKANSDADLQIAFPISETSRMAWAVEKNNPLIQEVENFFETIASNGILDEFFYRRFGLTYSSYLDLLNKNLRLEKYERDLEEILSSGKIVVALRERSFIYREGGQKQFMHALAEEFADYLGVDLEFVVTPAFEQYWQAGDGEVYRDSSYTPEWFTYFDLACETIAPLDWRSNKVNLVPVYPSSYVVLGRKNMDIRSIDDLKDLKGVTGRQTVYEDILRERGITNFYHANVNEFVRDVALGKADYTLVYNAFQELSEYPGLEVKMELGGLDVCWAMREEQAALQKELETFIAASGESGLIAVLLKALRGNTLQSPEAFINSYYESLQTGQMPYVNYGADKGLPQEDVFSIFQDQKGYIWFGTNSGAVRYNGREMTVFNHEDGLVGNSVRDIRQDSSGCIYLATTKGIGLYRNGEISDTLLPGTSFRKVFIPKNQRAIFIGDEGIFTRDKDDRIIHLNRRFPELPATTYQVAETSEGKILLATILGIYLYNPESVSLEHLTSSESYSLYVDANDSVWISTRDGLQITHLDKLMKGISPREANGLNEKLKSPGQRITQISTSKYGSVWLISDSKIFQVNSIDQEPVVYEQEIGIKNNKILSFLVDQEDNIWIGFSGGLQRLTNRKGLRNFYPGTINSYVYSVFQDQQDRIWISSDNGLFYFSQGQLQPFRLRGIPSNTRFSGSLLPDGNILLASPQGLFNINSSSLELMEKKLLDSPAHSPENLFVSSEGEIFLLTGIQGMVYHFENFQSDPVVLKNKYTSNLFQLVEYGGRIVGGNSSGFVEFREGDFRLLETADCNIWTLQREGELLWVGTDCGIGIVRNGRFEDMEFTSFDQDLVIKSILPARNRQYLWLGTNKGFTYYNTMRHEFEFTVNASDGLSGDEITPGGLMLDRNDLLWVGTYHGISNFNIRAKTSLSYTPLCYIEKMILNGNEIKAVSGSSFAHNENNIVFEVSALSFSDETSVEYEYYLRGLENKYSSYHRGKEFRASYGNLPPGRYEFIYKAKGKNNIWGYAEKFSFHIRKSWYSTWVFRIGLALFLVIGTYMLYLYRVASIKAQKNRLEREVKTRTHDLEVANTEIEAQRDYARFQRDQIAQHRQAIMDSIHYAQTIQTSLLPGDKSLEEILPDHFIFFKPRDIVSGDFYWIHESDRFLYLTAADCTGHGVPGAFMSMLGMALLNEIISKYPDLEPHDLLNHLRSQIIDTLHQESDPEAARDGMDMVVLRLDKASNKVHFAGANNPLYLRRRGEIQEYKTNKMPVSIHLTMRPFDLFELELEKEDALFIFSDGYADQFGGKDGKKMKYRRMREELLRAEGKDIRDQGRKLEEFFLEWMGDNQQVDDVVLIGLQF